MQAGRGLSLPTQGDDDALEIRRQGRPDQQRFSALGVAQLQRGRGQQQTLVGEVPGKELVVAPVAVGGIADDGVKDMLEMAAELVLATGFGCNSTRE